MSIDQLNFDGKNKIEVAIDRFKMFEPSEGYYLAFSGGKDSIVIKKLAELSGVKFDAHYNITGIDPPELVYFIRKNHPDVIMHQHEKSIFELIEEKCIPPTRLVRYCCAVLKEGGGIGRFVVTGVRWAESIRRKNNRDMIEFDRYGSNGKEAKENRKIFLNSDNDDKRKMIETCAIKGKHILNPIIDWTDDEVWEFIKKYKIPYCKLYDEGFKRIGCIGCPMGGKKGMNREFKRYPKYKQNYIKAFNRMLLKRQEKGLETKWESGKDVMKWWIG